MSDVAMVLIDTETTGLDFKSDHILELGMMALKLDFTIIDTFDRLVHNPQAMQKLHKMAADVEHGFADTNTKIVIDMHNENGLIRDLEKRRGLDPAIVEIEAIAWLETLGVAKGSLPVVGSNVANFDRRFLIDQMPRLNDFFHYRNVDISSIKEWLRLFHPALKERLEAERTPLRLHRVLADCADSRAELMTYTQGIMSNARV